MLDRDRDREEVERNRDNLTRSKVVVQVKKWAALEAAVETHSGQGHHPFSQDGEEATTGARLTFTVRVEVL